MNRSTLTCLATLIALGAPAAAVAAPEIAVRAQNIKVPAGGSYFQPMNAPNNKIMLYSYQKTRYTIDNKGAAPVTIESITIEPQGNGKPWEWSILDPRDLKNPVLVVKNESIAPKKTLDFIVKFSPVVGNERKATVTIKYGGGKSYQFTARGKGRPVKTRFASAFVNGWERALGGDKSDEMVTGLALDANENLYVSGNVTQVVHTFNHDVFVGQVTKDGKLGWLRAWSGKHQDYQRDPGQNAESGGSAGAIRSDGKYLYLCLSHSATKSNNSFFGVVLKIDAASGKIEWQRAFGPKTGKISLVKESCELYALDVDAKHVYACGTYVGGLLLLVLDKASGAVVHQKAIEVAPTYVDRAYAIRADGKGGVYVGGLTNGRGLLLHVDAIASETPKITWCKKLSMGIGSNVDDIDVDADGNAYLSCDRRGASTAFSFMRVNRDGKVAWAKTYNARDRGSKNNTHVIRVFGQHVYVGGRGGIPWHDGQFGDAVLLRAKAADGALEWSGFYFNGKGAETMAEHRIKGIALAPSGKLYVAGQVYSNVHNSAHFAGHWYDGADQQYVDYKRYSLSDQKPVMVDVPPAFGAIDASKLETYEGWVDLKVDKPLAKSCDVMNFGPLRENQGSPPDGDAWLTVIELKK